MHVQCVHDSTSIAGCCWPNLATDRGVQHTAVRHSTAWRGAGLQGLNYTGDQEAYNVVATQRPGQRAAMLPCRDLGAETRALVATTDERTGAHVQDTPRDPATSYSTPYRTAIYG